MTSTARDGTGHLRILVAGGGGEMGAHVCRTLVKSELICEVVVADRDVSRATSLATSLGPIARPMALDISNADAVSAALADIDIVLNTAGPFYRFGREVLSAAIATRTNYLDICDDWEPTLEMFGLDDAARAAGVTAVIGMGASPGTSNLLAVLAMNQCETVDRVFTAWRAGALPYPTENDPDPTPSAAMEHWMHSCTEPIRTWRNGALTDAWALEEMSLTYPGRAEESVWVCGHPEALTLPRVRTEVKDSLNVMVARRGLMEGLQRITSRVRTGELDVASACRQLLREPKIGGVAAGPAPILPSLFAVAEGTVNGEHVRVGTRPLILPDATMGEMTGFPLAIATLMMARGLVNRPGVHGPEGAIDPEIYFHDLSMLVEDRPAGPAYELIIEKF